MKIKFMVILVALLLPLFAQANTPSEKSFSWRSSVIGPQENELVARTHEVFNRLLSAWDDNRIAPALHVIDARGGMWAAALDSGEIVMTLSAVETALGTDVKAGMSRLAFVLAHELVHLRSDDLWHKRFFRLMGDVEPGHSEEQYETFSQEELKKKEMRADAEGLVLMSLVGYDPVAIVGEEDFFTTWVESLFGISCSDGSGIHQSVAKDACGEAQRRVFHGLEQLNQVANQSLLFDLAVQSYVAGQYGMARMYFSAFALIYPSRAVQTNIGLSYLGEAMSYRQQLNALLGGRSLQFTYPVIVGAMEPVKFWAKAGVRGVTGPYRGSGGISMDEATLRQKLESAAESAVEAFEIAKKKAPNSRQTYIHLTSAYLLNHNIHMAKGIVEGIYAPKFGHDLGYQLLSAMILALEGEHGEARKLMLGLVNTDESAIARDDINREMFLYTATYNLAELLRYLDNSRDSDAQWHQLVKRSKEKGDALLFRLSLKHLELVPLMQNGAYSVRDQQLFVGGQLDAAYLKNSDYQRQVWVDGRPLYGYEYDDGMNVVVDSGNRVVALWNDGGQETHDGVFGRGDESAMVRIIKNHGVPNRQIYTERGSYLAYDSLGLAYQVFRNRIDGWFYYGRMDSGN